MALGYIYKDIFTANSLGKQRCSFPQEQRAGLHKALVDTEHLSLSGAQGPSAHGSYTKSLGLRPLL